MIADPYPVPMVRLGCHGFFPPLEVVGRDGNWWWRKESFHNEKGAPKRCLGSTEDYTTEFCGKSNKP